MVKYGCRFGAGPWTRRNFAAGVGLGLISWPESKLLFTITKYLFYICRLERSNMQLNDFTKECTDLRKKEVDLQTEISRLNELVCRLNKKVAFIEDSVSSQRTFFKTIKRATTPNSIAPSSNL